MGVPEHAVDGQTPLVSPTLRADADSRRSKASPAPDPTAETAAADAAPAHPPTPAASLDFEIAPARAEKVDLTPLDAEFEKARRGPSRPQKRTLRKGGA